MLCQLLLTLTLIVSHAVSFDQLQQSLSNTELQKAPTFEDFSESFNDYINNLLATTNTPGLSVAVLHKNTTWSRGYGYARYPPSDTTSLDLDHQPVPVTKDTLFHACSITKSFTAALTSTLIHSGHYPPLSWDTRIAFLIRDDFVLDDSYAAEHVTIADALSHRTGLPGHDVSWLNGGNATSQKAIVRRMRILPFKTELRAGWSYCNLMFIAVGHALEVLTGEDVGSMIEDLLLKPIGMDATVFGFPAAVKQEEATYGRANVARPQLWNNDSEQFTEVELQSLPLDTAAGGIITTPTDLAKWMQHLMYAPNNIKEILYPQFPLEHPVFLPDVHTAHTAYALGLETGTYRGYTYYGHPGSLGGYLACMYFVPELEWGFAGMQNGHSYAYMGVLYKLMDDLLDGVGARGGRVDVLEGARRVEKRHRSMVEDGRSVVFPDAPDGDGVRPALPLAEYEGMYVNVAYQNISFSATGEEGDLRLEGTGSTDGSLNMTWTLHHVSGEHWWVLFKEGQGYWNLESLLEAKFDIGVNGKVSGLWLQVERELEDLAWFEKVV